jgi:hypothetical protein
MSRPPRLTDDVLRAALDLEPAGTPAALLGAIASEVRSTAQERGRLSALHLPAVAGRSGVGAPRSAWALVLATALLLAFAGGVLVGAQLIRERLVRPVPPAELTSPAPIAGWVPAAVVDLPPGIAPGDRGLSIAPVSAEEAWVADGQALWHYADGAWSGPFATGLPARSALEEADGRPLLEEIAVSSDGVVWGVTAGGLARWDGDRWEVVIPYDAIVSVRAAPDGTVWAGTTGDGISSTTWRLGNEGTASSVVCGYPGGAITPAADGSLYVWGTQWGINHQLWRIDGSSCIRLDPPWAGASAWVDDVRALPDGSVVLALRERANDDRSRPGQLVRFDGSRWTALGEFTQAVTPSAFFTDPTGGIWRLVADGGLSWRLERLDAGSWVATEPDLDLVEGAMGVVPAPDGSLWFWGGARGLARLIPTGDPATTAP